MSASDEPWSAEWTMVKLLGGGGQGDTSLVKSKKDGTDGVLKTLKKGKAKDKKARARMFQEVFNLNALANQGATVPRVLTDGTKDYLDASVTIYFVMQFISPQSSEPGGV